MGNTSSAAAAPPPKCQPGCSPTSAVSQAISQVQSRQPSVTPDPISECQANKIDLYSVQRKVDAANSKVEACDPSIELARRRARIEATQREFVKTNRETQNKLNTSIQEKFRTVTDLAEAVKVLKQYEKKLKDELAALEKDTLLIEHDERKYRRDFLDNQPTDGVQWHVFGLQTSDDKVMLTFWITALISFSFLAHIVFVTISPNENLKGRAIKGTITVVLALFISYLLITYTG